MFKLLLLAAVLAAVKTDFIENKVINHNWKILAVSPQGDLTNVLENCVYSIIATKNADVDCTCGPVKAHVLDTIRLDGKSVTELFVPVESRDDINSIREVSCDCPAGVYINGTSIYVKELEPDYILAAPDEENKLNYLVLGRSAPTQAKLQELLKAADVVKGEPKENWIVTCVNPDN